MASILDVVRDVKGPRPVLSRETEDALTPRQREVLDQLHEVFLDGFAHLTMAEMAAAASCSLRTLYEVASGKDELVRIVVDRHLWGIGRTAMAAVTAAGAGAAMAAVMGVAAETTRFMAARAMTT